MIKFVILTVDEKGKIIKFSELIYLMKNSRLYILSIPLLCNIVFKVQPIKTKRLKTMANEDQANEDQDE